MMRPVATIAAGCALVASGADAASWSKPANALGSAVVGVGAGSDTVAFAAAGDNGVGAEVLVTKDGGKSYARAETGTSVLFLDASASSATNAVVNGLFGAQYTVDGNAFKGSVGGGGQGQSVESFGTSSFGIAGGFGGKGGGGVAVSTNGGKSFQSFSAGAALDENHPARYAAYPSGTTWYVSAGAWPTNNQDKVGSDEHSELVKHLNERVQLRQRRSDGGLFYRYLELSELGTPNNITQYTSAIAKTTDGGKTFTKVFEKDGSFYFNGIHCHSEEHCIAVAEGHNVANPGAYIFVTRDAGKTWNSTHFDAGAGSTLMGARMVSDTEGWAVGGKGSGLSFSAHFWHTMDGGSTWKNEPLDGFIGMGVDCFDATHCFAPGITFTRQGTVASYN